MGKNWTKPMLAMVVVFCAALVGHTIWSAIHHSMFNADETPFTELPQAFLSSLVMGIGAVGICWVYMGLVSALIAKLGYQNDASKRVATGAIMFASTLAVLALLEVAGLHLEWASVTCLLAMGASGTAVVAMRGWSPMYQARARTAKRRK